MVVKAGMLDGWCVELRGFVGALLRSVSHVSEFVPIRKVPLNYCEFVSGSEVLPRDGVWRIAFSDKWTVDLVTHRNARPLPVLASFPFIRRPQL